MFVLSALFVVLPLVNGALDSCDPNKVSSFQGKQQLPEPLLGNFADKGFLVVAASTEDVGTTQSAEAIFGSQADNSVPVKLVFYDSDGSSRTIFESYTLEEDHLYSTGLTIYLFECSQNLIGGHICENEGQTGDFGPAYFVLADSDTDEDTISGEVDSCFSQFTSVDSSATFSRLTKH